MIFVSVLLFLLFICLGFWFDWGRSVKAINKIPKIIAHRGDSGNAPENTLAAVELAIKKGAEIVEVDVHLTRDEEVVVIHDPTIDRTTTGVGKVDHYSLEELKTLDAGSWFGPAFEGEKIPTLSEVIELIDGRARLLIEIKKGTEGPYVGIEQAILDIVAKQEAQDWVIYQSFEQEVMDRILTLAPEAEHHKLIIGGFPFVYHDGKFRSNSLWELEGVNSVNPYYKFLGPYFVNSAHRNGIKVFTYTVDHPKAMKRMARLGVDGIITNFPGKLKKVINPFSSLDEEDETKNEG